MISENKFIELYGFLSGEFVKEVSIEDSIELAKKVGYIKKSVLEKLQEFVKNIQGKNTK